MLVVRFMLGFFALCASVSMLGGRACGQNLPAPRNPARLRVSAGTIVSFQLQTRWKATAADLLDALPKGTLLRVKLLDSIDSAADQDGSAFRGLVVSPVARADRVYIHSGAEVRGLFALLRSATHPEGFRYELLVTRLVDGGRSYALTAFLDPDFATDAGTKAEPTDTLEPAHD